MIWHDLSHHVVVLAAANANGARVLKTRCAGKIGLSGGTRRKKVVRAAKVFVEEKENGWRTRFLIIVLITTTAWSTPHHRLRRSLSSRRSLLVAALSYIYKKVRFPLIRFALLDTFPRLEKAFIVMRFSCWLAVLSNNRKQIRTTNASNHAPAARRL